MFINKIYNNINKIIKIQKFFTTNPDFSKNYFKILNLNENASQAEIKQ
jgi:hypothetical protein